MTISDDCPVCRLVADHRQDEVAYEDDDIVVVAARDQFQARPGHMLVVLRPHVATVTELPAGRMGPVLAVLRRVALSVESVFGTEGTTIRPGDGSGHAYFHVIPRSSGDEPLVSVTQEATAKELAGHARRVGDALRSSAAGT